MQFFYSHRKDTANCSESCFFIVIDLMIYHCIELKRFV